MMLMGLSLIFSTNGHVYKTSDNILSYSVALAIMKY